MRKTVSGIVLAAGDSTRYGKGKNKNFEMVQGKPILSYSLDVFSKCTLITDIILVIRKEDEKIVSKMLPSFSKPISIVYGGSTRMESVMHALMKSNAQYVVIHDGARPLIQPRFIEECLSAMKEYSASLVGVKVKDTIKILNEKREVLSTTKRDDTYIAQTPQCFQRKLLLSLHEKYKKEGNTITDDAMLMEKEGYPVKVVEGDYTNIKVTTPDDFHIVSSLLGKM